MTARWSGDNVASASPISHRSSACSISSTAGTTARAVSPTSVGRARRAAGGAAAEAAGAVRVDGDVARDGEQPGPDGTSLRVERLRVPPRTQQRLLHDVLGAAAVAA